MRQRGIALIISLFMALVILMTLTGAYILLSGKSSASSQLQNRSAAKDAAEAGYRFALTRLQDNSSWEGNSTVQVNDATDGLVVVEGKGNVLGFLTDRAGEVSQFRIRFNSQNGSDPLGTPAALDMLNTTYVSVNNLQQTSSVPYPLTVPGGHDPVSGFSTTSFVPAACCSLTVTGLAGSAVQGTSPAHPNPIPGSPLVQQVERDLICYGDGTIYDSSIYAGSDISANTNGDFLVNSSKPTAAPRIRGLNNLNLGKLTNYSSTSGFVSLAGTGTAPGLPGSVSLDHTSTGAMFPPLSWSLLPTGTSTLPAGTYVVGTGGALRYYNVDSQTVPGGGGGSVTFPTGMSYNYGNFTVSQVINVAPTATAHGFQILTDPGFLNLGLRPSVTLTGQNAALTSTDLAGSLYVQGNVMGTGSLWSAKNIEIQGTSVLQPNAGSKVAVYAKGDITVDPVPAPVTSLLGSIFNIIFGSGPQPQDIDFNGILFAQGNVKAALSPANGGGSFAMRGILTAFGGDPDAGAAPGSNGGGQVSVTASNATITFDPSYASQIYQSGNGGKMSRMSTAILVGN